MGTDIFLNKAVKPQQVVRMEDIQRNFGMLLDTINPLIPDGREKSLMITKLEEACMWGTKAISREEVEDINLD